MSIYIVMLTAYIEAPSEDAAMDETAAARGLLRELDVEKDVGITILEADYGESGELTKL